MPTAATRRFGALEYDDSSVLRFPFGLPGFEQETRFALVEQAELAPMVFLQSLDCADLCFLAAPVRAIDPSYSINVTAEDWDRIGVQPPGDQALCLALLCAPENGPLTANLLAPVLVNPATRIAVQAVRADARYSHQHVVSTEAACL